MSKFVRVATIDELAEQPVKCVEVEGQKIALFDVRSGAVLGPPAAVGVKSYRVRVAGEDIAIEI